MPSCCVCGETFTVDHSLCCSHGGYLGIRHDEVRDLLGQLLNETSPNVSLEPTLQPLTGEQFPFSSNTTQEAHVDIKARGFWSARWHVCIFLILGCFTHMHAPTVTAPSSKGGELVRQESSTSMVGYLRLWSLPLLEAPILQLLSSWRRRSCSFCLPGGADPAASVFLEHLGSKIAEKKDTSYLAACHSLCFAPAFYAFAIAKAGWHMIMPAWPCNGWRLHHGHLWLKERFPSFDLYALFLAFYSLFCGHIEWFLACVLCCWLFILQRTVFLFCVFLAGSISISVDLKKKKWTRQYCMAGNFIRNCFLFKPISGRAVKNRPIVVDDF